ncbi:MAG TPA: pilus assembly protein TadG-related protein [Pyrinomonadaceae bacterium]|nr:pilus assembly protein TadG-related protein [Pyrinomonadaceae bacterium]
MTKGSARGNKSRHGERGSILALSTVGMLSILLAVGLAVDISHFYLVKAELQNAADAASLAAASSINSNPSGIIEGTSRAVAQMNNYEFNNTNIVFSRSDVQWAANLEGPYISEAAAATPGQAPTIRFAKVTTPSSSVGVSFAALILGASKNLSATATAGLSIPLNTFCNFIPLSVLIDNDDSLLVPGQTYVIRANTGGSPSPGNYQILAVAGAGGVDVGYGIGSGVDACAKPGDEYSVDTKPGLTSGKVRTGVNSRFDDYQGSQLDPVNQPPDTNIKENITWDDYQRYFGCGRPNAIGCNSQYFREPSHDGVDMRRVVLIPLVKVSEYDQGRNVVRFFRFGAFFLKTKVGGGNGGELEAEYIEDRIAIGEGQYDPTGPAGDPLLAAPVLYK